MGGEEWRTKKLDVGIDPEIDVRLFVDGKQKDRRRLLCSWWRNVVEGKEEEEDEEGTVGVDIDSRIALSACCSSLIRLPVDG